MVLYSVSGVKPLFNGKHLMKRKIYVAVYTYKTCGKFSETLPSGC